jgi:hypothetical protein
VERSPILPVGAISIPRRFLTTIFNSLKIRTSGVSIKTALVAAKLASKIPALTRGANNATTATIYQLATKSGFNSGQTQKLINPLACFSTQ